MKVQLESPMPATFGEKPIHLLTGIWTVSSSDTDEEKTNFMKRAKPRLRDGDREFDYKPLPPLPENSDGFDSLVELLVKEENGELYDDQYIITDNPNERVILLG